VAAEDPKRWECTALLADGGVALLRPARTDDADRISALHSRLSDETIHLRFFSAMPKLQPLLLERFTHVDYHTRTVLLALLGDDAIGMASYDRTDGTDAAEVAFVVDDAHQGRGLGTLLLEHLAVIARAYGIDRFTANTLSHNRRMIQVFRDAGFGIERSREHGVVHIEFPIEPSEQLERAVERREHHAEARSVARLLEPKALAVIGAGRERGNLGHEIFRNLLAGGFVGPVHPIHPSARKIAGKRAHPRVTDVSGDVDVAIVAVPVRELPGVVAQCAEKGVHGLVVISAGFAEAGSDGARAERELVATARRNGMRVIGPNCMGVANTSPQVRMNATFAPVVPPPGRIGFLSQSGALGIAILERAGELGLGISSFVSVGNKADISGNDLLQYWEEDPATDVILLYLESFGNPRKFSRIARRVSSRKPIVAVKSGRSVSGSRGASSHTAALASPDLAVDALFQQTGVIRVDTVEQLFDMAQVLSHQPLPPGPRVAIMGNSGGPGVLAADACERAGLEVPELPAALQERLREFLPRGAGVRNPVDLVAEAGPEEYRRALELLLAEPCIDAVIAIYTPPLVTRPDEIAAALASAARGAGPKPVLASFLATGGVPAALRGGDGPGRPIPSFPFPESAAQALARAASYAEWRRRPAGRAAELAGIDRDRARRLVTDALGEAKEPVWLDPQAAFELLACYGVPALRPLRAESAAEAAELAAAHAGPVALKAGSAEIVHKTDVGAVRLGLTTEAEVRAAFETMRERLGARMGGALVQPMAEPGVETIVGVVNDPSFGPLVMFGLGGTAAELLADRAFRILPLTDLDARELIRSIRSAPLLFGYRGAPAVDVAGLEELLLRIGRMADELPEIGEMDLNPVIVSAKGAVVVDVRVRLTPYVPRPELAMRALR
jgi:acetyl coenzyme A synthetase (ADP forming)-like protein